MKPVLMLVVFLFGGLVGVGIAAAFDDWGKQPPEYVKVFVPIEAAPRVEAERSGPDPRDTLIADLTADLTQINAELRRFREDPARSKVVSGATMEVDLGDEPAPKSMPLTKQQRVVVKGHLDRIAQDARKKPDDAVAIEDAIREARRVLLAELGEEGLNGLVAYFRATLPPSTGDYARDYLERDSPLRAEDPLAYRLAKILGELQ